ncbi:hypothetical protein BGZ83_001881 [Gryganskiella cystojenkinii]|nr:hypothetical protein BGZ83_001881 [Gryganskiella cystojenkinii]
MAPKVISRWAHSSEITGLAYTPDGRYVITTSDDDHIHLFPQEEGQFKSIGDKIETDAPITCVAATTEFIYTGSNDGCIRQYDLESKEFVGLVVRYELAVRCLAVSPNKKLLAVGTESADLKIIVLDEREDSYALKGHKKALSNLSFDPKGEFLVSSGCDGHVIIWNIKTQSKTFVDNLQVGPPAGTDSKKQIPIAWHPSGEYFAMGKEKDIETRRRDIWQKIFTYKTGSDEHVERLAWSPNGKFLAAASSKAEVCVWQYKEKEKPMEKHKHASAVTAVSWAPDANRLTFADAGGEITRWDEVVPSDKGMPFTPKEDLDSLFDDTAKEDRTDAAEEDQEMGEDYVSDSESVLNFIVDDEDSTKKYLKRRPAGAPSTKTGSAPIMQAAKELHPRFQSGSTLENDQKKRYLAFNMFGSISTLSHGDYSTISVDFHDKVTPKGYRFKDSSHFSMACLGRSGVLFAAPAKDKNPCTVFYKSGTSWDAKSEWQIYLPVGEDVTALAVNSESAIVCTTRGYVRVFSPGGVQTGLFSVGSVIAASGRDDMVLLVYRMGEPFEGSQNLGYSIYNVESGQRIQQGTMPVMDDTFVTWLGFSEGGIPAFYDDNGVMHILNYYRRIDQGQWTPILETALHHTESESDSALQPHYWPVGLTDRAMHCVRCKRGETEPEVDSVSFLTELSLKMPTLHQETATGQLEEALLRTRIMSGLVKDEKLVTTVASSDAEERDATKMGAEVDKLIVKLVYAASKSNRGQKIEDLAAMLVNIGAFDSIKTIIEHHNLHGLKERLAQLREIKLKADENWDPETEADLIMANPVLAERTSKDSSRSRVSSRTEEKELEMKAFQRRDPVSTNDPFGRRVVKENTFSRSNVQGSSTSTASAGSNPFKKKTGGNASTDVAGGPRGFGIVKETDRNALPITRRATDVFQAADYLAADEQRSRADREKLARQEETVRKRKANGVVNSGGGQKTLDVFSKGASSSSFPSSSTSGSSSADAKRLKRQETVESQEILTDADTMMDADDFLEEEREESMPPAAQVIPATQDVRAYSVAAEDDGDLLDDSIEVTRHRLEKSQMQTSDSPSPPQPRSSSSVLAGFKFSKQ